ncbi:MAG TPA: hypothetical protein VIL46_06665, partial [Gemmataceae bacterium]
MPEPPARRRLRLLRELQGQSLETAYLRTDIRADLEAEAASGDPDALFTPDALAHLEELVRERQRQRPEPALFFSTDYVVIVPGFMGSSLSDTAPRGYGLLWIDPKIYFSDQLKALQLGPYRQPEADLLPGVTVRATGPLPVIYGLLDLELELRRYRAETFPVDWRKDLDEAARLLCERIKHLLGTTSYPLHLVAHSQGALVARRALELFAAGASGEDFDRVRNLVLLGPANGGSFSAAFALAGRHEMMGLLRRLAVEPPAGFTPILQSMTGAYQLLPYDEGRLPWLGEDAHNLGRKAFWKPFGIDAKRLEKFYGWGRAVDQAWADSERLARFLRERTTILLGDNFGRPTVAGVRVTPAGEMVASHEANGDGTVPHRCAVLEGARVYVAAGAEHMKLPMTRHVIEAVANVLAGKSIHRGVGGQVRTPRAGEVEDHWAPGARPAAPAAAPAALAEGAAPPVTQDVWCKPAPEAPPFRRLRVFAFDPSLGYRLETEGINEITLRLPWERDRRTGADLPLPGPVGEYLEVIDYDPSTGVFYDPVDLNDPYLLAQDGLAPSESDPRFHQQMAYAVAMTTVRAFERALGRVALWSPRLVRDPKTGTITRDEYVARLRVYPHALREANAYYSPEKKALLFGYFPAPPQARGGAMPGGTVFTCLSHDVVAHETTHALLDGMHRYFLYPSNPDVHAFHEAFADLVALFQHFSHPGVLRDQIARTRGRLAEQQSLLGQLAVQFGQAIGHYGALRTAIGTFDEATGEWKPETPDPARYELRTEPHARGAILVAAVFDAFLAIFQRRVADLLRIAGGGGAPPEGELHPELVERLAAEAAKAAGHLQVMCARALDYLPPVDVTFAEYLRALITADADLVPDDPFNYRVALIDAFRRRGIFPRDAGTLSADGVRWQRPLLLLSDRFAPALEKLVARTWDVGADREEIYRQQCRDCAFVHEFLEEGFAGDPALAAEIGRFLGVVLSYAERGPEGEGYASIPANRDGRPKFEVHSVRPLRRVGPDGDVLTDLVVVLTQRRFGYRDPKVQQKVDAGEPAPAAKLRRPDFYFRGGCTLLIDRETREVRYC